MRRYVLTMVLAAVMGFATIANASLVDRGNGLIYDTYLNITWYDYTYQGAGSGATWQQAVDWAAGLTVSGVSGWRLPSSLNPDGSGPCSGYKCSGSEMGRLYYTEFGLNAYPTEPYGVTLSNQSPFISLKPSGYWSGTEYAPYTQHAWRFHFLDGSQRAAIKVSGGYSLAVHSGDVGAPMPIPGAVWLLGSGLIGLAGFRRRMNHK